MHSYFSFLSVLFCFSLSSLSAQNATNNTWQVDNLHSQIFFQVGHMGIAQIFGSFGSYEVQFAPKDKGFEDLNLNIEIDVASINTGVEMRDGHLRSADFFDAEQYPTMIFSSSSFKKKKRGKYEMQGTLTLKGITKPITLDVRMGKQVTDLDGNTRIGFVAKTVLNRQDFNVKFNKKMDNDAWLVDNEVEISISMEFVQAAQKD